MAYTKGIDGNGNMTYTRRISNRRGYHIRKNELDRLYEVYLIIEPKNGKYMEGKAVRKVFLYEAHYLKDAKEAVERYINAQWDKFY